MAPKHAIIYCYSGTLPVCASPGSLFWTNWSVCVTQSWCKIWLHNILAYFQGSGPMCLFVIPPLCLTCSHLSCFSCAFLFPLSSLSFSPRATPGLCQLCSRHEVFPALLMLTEYWLLFISICAHWICFPLLSAFDLCLFSHTSHKPLGFLWKKHRQIAGCLILALALAVVLVASHDSKKMRATDITDAF